MTNSKNSSNNSLSSNELYAIAETSGKQFWFEVNRYYDIDEALDAVGKEDGDIDNDGDKDDSDEYLAKRRKAIAKAIKKQNGDK